VTTVIAITVGNGAERPSDEKSPKRWRCPPAAGPIALHWRVMGRNFGGE